MMAHPASMGQSVRTDSPETRVATASLGREPKPLVATAITAKNMGAMVVWRLLSAGAVEQAVREVAEVTGDQAVRLCLVGQVETVESVALEEVQGWRVQRVVTGVMRRGTRPGMEAWLKQKGKTADKSDPRAVVETVDVQGAMAVSEAMDGPVEGEDLQLLQEGLEGKVNSEAEAMEGTPVPGVAMVGKVAEQVMVGTELKVTFYGRKETRDPLDLPGQVRVAERRPRALDKVARETQGMEALARRWENRTAHREVLGPPGTRGV